MSTTPMSTRTPATAAPALRYSAAAATILMSVMNLPFAFDGPAGTPEPLAWLVTVFGVVGIAAAVGLLRKAAWGPWAVTVVGAVNLAGGVAAFVRDQEGALIGVALSLVIVALGLACVRRRAARA